MTIKTEDGRELSSAATSDSNHNLGLHALQQKTKRLLTEAIRYERAKNWKKTVETYRSILKILSKKNFPIHFSPNASLKMLLYEVHYHLAMALQYVGEDRLAVRHLTRSLAQVGVVKGGCGAKCISDTCLQTPVYARRAFALCVSGNPRAALRDAETCIVLDRMNPDVYCVRAMAMAALGHEQLAIDDCKHALKMNKHHISALLLKGAVSKVKIEKSGSAPPNYNPKELTPDQRKAIELHADAINYVHVSDFNSKRAVYFYDRLLFSLNIPHTVTEREVLISGDARTTAAANPPAATATRKSRSQSAATASARSTTKTPPPFRCGSGNRFVETPESLYNRFNYDTLLRSHRAALENQIAMSQLGSKSAASTSQQSDGYTRSESAPFQGFRLVSAPGSIQTDPGMRVGDRYKQSKRWQIGRPASALPVVENPKPAKEAPRMYVKPWARDKLPVTELPERPPQPRVWIY